MRKTAARVAAEEVPEVVEAISRQGTLADSRWRCADEEALRVLGASLNSMVVSAPCWLAGPRECAPGSVREGV